MFSRMLSHGGAVYVDVYVPANSSGHIGFLRKLAEEAVISEPVSARWFPVPRENTGKFADFGLEIAKAPRLSEENSIAYQ
jgi:hypothetical protein